MAVVVDTTVWVDHLRAGEPALIRLLEKSQVLGHPWVTGEVALGSLRDRAGVLGLLGQLPQALVASPSEVLVVIERHGLGGVGIGIIHAQLLASALLTGRARLWTRDERLARAAAGLGVVYPLSRPGDDDLRGAPEGAG